MSLPGLSQVRDPKPRLRVGAGAAAAAATDFSPERVLEPDLSPFGLTLGREEDRD